MNEKRTLDANETELRFDEADGKIVGYAAVFNDLSSPIGGQFRERILPGAFKNLRGDDDIISAVNHDDSKVLGRKSAGNLDLTVTKRGLRYSITPPDTSYVRDLVENIRAGNVQGSSFEFRVREGGDGWVANDGEMIRELRALDVFEVGPVTRPAYPTTDVAMRSLEVWRSEQVETEPEVEVEPETEAAPEQTPVDVLREKLNLTEQDGHG